MKKMDMGEIVDEIEDIKNSVESLAQKLPSGDETMELWTRLNQVLSILGECDRMAVALHLETKR